MYAFKQFEFKSLSNGWKIGKLLIILFDRDFFFVFWILLIECFRQLGEICV